VTFYYKLSRTYLANTEGKGLLEGLNISCLVICPGDDMEKNRKLAFRRNFAMYADFVKPYYATVIIVIFLVLFFATAKTVEKFLFKILIDSGTEFTTGVITTARFVDVLFFILAVFIGTVIVMAVTGWAKFHLLIRLDAKIIFDLKKKYFNQIVDLSHRFHASHRPGSLISKMTRSSRAIERVNDFIMFEALSLFIELVIVFIAILYLDFASAMVLIVMVVLFIGYSLLTMYLGQEANLRLNDSEDIEKGHIGDSFTNIETTKFFGKEGRIKWVFEKFIGNTKLLDVKFGNYTRWLIFGHVLILGLSVIMLLYFPLVAFINGTITIGTVAFIYAVYLNISAPLSRFSLSY